MKMTIESTAKVVTLTIDGKEIPARIWQGQTEAGVPVHCFITRVAVAERLGLEATLEFERDLESTAPARPEIEAIPLRLVL